MTLVCMVCGSQEYENISFGEWVPVSRRCTRCFTPGKFIEVDDKDAGEVSEKIYEKFSES